MFKAHTDRVSIAFAEKNKDSHSSASTLVFTHDTESLLLSSPNNANAMYYRTKLNEHNVTYFKIKN